MRSVVRDAPLRITINDNEGCVCFEQNPHYLFIFLQQGCLFVFNNIEFRKHLVDASSFDCLANGRRFIEGVAGYDEM